MTRLFFNSFLVTSYGFCLISISILGLILLLDNAIGVARYLLTGIFTSSWQSWVMSENFPVSEWKIASGAIGFDRIINAFLELQYSETGRWVLLLGCLGFLLLFILKTITGHKLGLISPLTDGDEKFCIILGFVLAIGTLVPTIAGALYAIVQIEDVTRNW